jgi:uncharacterized protein YgbK (DUF1537 family)
MEIQYLDEAEMEIRRRRRAQARALRLLIIAAAALGTALLVHSLMGRQAKIEETQEKIASLLGELDPIARLQVAEYVIETEIGKF